MKPFYVDMEMYNERIFLGLCGSEIDSIARLLKRQGIEAPDTEWITKSRGSCATLESAGIQIIWVDLPDVFTGTGSYEDALGVLVHECFHAAMNLAWRIGYDPANEQEPLAYAQQYLFNRMARRLRKSWEVLYAESERLKNCDDKQ